MQAHPDVKHLPCPMANLYPRAAVVQQEACAKRLRVAIGCCSQGTQSSIGWEVEGCMLRIDLCILVLFEEVPDVHSKLGARSNVEKLIQLHETKSLQRAESMQRRPPTCQPRARTRS
eukprot:gnl/TRDRNA2_/TRDRNA2_152353_c1_seq1.p2 gnl/TRDRNA2_/TRDRNA2_152353_c1~~gnl/TRDRNA2_/TRDRNA2_152353_c1_seq1.p2  ORF type:complete len:117 (+),score=11.32 gnl/TRDRNA2_/TRDRNA2_152353_c1_seq1:223-573(+)